MFPHEMLMVQKFHEKKRRRGFSTQLFHIRLWQHVVYTLPPNYKLQSANPASLR